MLLIGLGGSAAANEQIGGTGNIEPRAGVVLLSGVTGATILGIRVRVGDRVKRGDVLMTLDDQDARSDEQLAVLALQQATRTAQESVANQAVAVRLAQERLRHAERSAAAYRSLGPDATSVKETSDLAEAVTEARLDLGLEQAKDRQIRADTTSDVQSATTRLQEAKNKLERYRIVAPSDGVILRIDQHVGENLTGTAAIEMGDTSKMYVDCQLFQGDLLKVKPGMKATIKSGALPNSLAGTVEEVGHYVDTKAQLGDVWIRLDNPNIASRLVGMEVEVQIAR